jgi:hypothetical protein
MSFAGEHRCMSCSRGIESVAWSPIGLPGLVAGDLCPDCLHMASHELLRRATRQLIDRAG